MKKNILLVNTGSTKKRFILQRINKLGLNVIALHSEKNWAAPYVDHWIFANTFKHNESIDKVQEFMEKNPDIKIDGILTFWEDDVLLTSKLIDFFGYTGIPYEKARVARNKTLFRQFCQNNNLPTTKHLKINGDDDIETVIDTFRFPVVIKPSYGSSSALVIKIETPDEIYSVYNYVKTNLSLSVESALNDGQDIMIEEYIEGDEVDIDILIQNGRIKFYGISDNTKTKEPFFVETDRYTPSQLPKKNQDDLIKMAEVVLEKLGINDGCIHFEAKSTKKGPVPLEVNLRMGGDEIYLSVKKAWKVDLIEQAIKIACGEYIEKVDSDKDTSCNLIARTLTTDHSGILSSLKISEKVDKKKFIEEVDVSKKVGDLVLVPPEGYEYLGWVLVSGDTHLNALDNINSSLSLINYEVSRFHKDSTIGSTKRKDMLSGLKIKRIEKLSKVSHSDLKKLKIGIAYASTMSDVTSIYDGLKDSDYIVERIDITNVRDSIDILKSKDFDLLFNLGDMNPNKSVMIPSIFDALEIPYTGSNSQSLTLSTNKITLKKLLSYHDIPTPKWDYMYDLDEEIDDDLNYPLMIKPATQDYGNGIDETNVVNNLNEAMDKVKDMLSKFSSGVIIEEYLEGSEFSVAIIGNEKQKILPMQKKGEDYVPIKQINKNLLALIKEIAVDTFNISKCLDYAVVDIVLDKGNNPKVLEINALPEISEDSVLVQAARSEGYNMTELLEEIMHICSKRKREQLMK